MARKGYWFVGFVMKPAAMTTSANLSGIDPEIERDPPERPLQIVFPFTNVPVAVRWSDAHPPPDFLRLCISSTKPGAVFTGHVKALNCNRKGACHADKLLPPRDDGTSFFPSMTYKGQTFSHRIAELNITNDAAFRALSKTTKPGDQAPRLAYLRKFWLSLGNMAEYWDTTADNYYQREVPVQPDPTRPDTILQSKERYKGRRTANGHGMPDVYRADTVRAFVEGVTSAFNCRVSQAYVAPGRRSPVLQVGKLEQPIPLTGIVMRLPTDRNKTKASILEGPAIGILERNTIDFTSAVEDVSWRKSEHDMVREIAAMLSMAQQRRREGKPAVSAGEGAFYTTKPRWGGGPGGKLAKLQQAEDDYDECATRLAKADTVTKAMEAEIRYAKAELSRQQSAAKKLPAMKCRPSLWDPKTDYKPIGKRPGSHYDEIFLVSCIYHHISIRKLTVHDAYTDYFTTGVMPNPAPHEDDWSTPLVERTVWLDLFDQAQRVEAFQSIWGVMEYVTRDVEAAGAAGTGEAGTEGTGESKQT